MHIWPFHRAREDVAAASLLATVTQASRQPDLYGAGRFSDTLDGRLEAIMVHAALALLRLQGEPGQARLAQSFTDLLFRYFDAGLREAGVGDLSVPRRMRRIAGDFHGRFNAYAGALKAGDEAALAAALARNGGLGRAHAGELAGWALETYARQGAAPLAALDQPGGWPPAPG